MWRLLPQALFGLVLALGLFQSIQAQTPQKEAVRAAATHTLEAHYPDRAGRLNVRVRSIRGDVDTAKTLQLQLSEERGSPTGLTQARLHTRRPGGGWEPAGWALLDVARADSVATVRSRVQGGQPVPVSNLETAWIETSDLRGEPIRVDEARARARQGTLVATRHLQSGRVLRRQDVRQPHTVDVGGAVRVVYRRGELVFRLSCTAREPGAIQDVIRVRCADLETMYRVRLTSENTGEWIETL